LQICRVLFRLWSAAALAGIAVLPNSVASATTPSRLWWGVERIVVVCDADSASQKFQASVCDAVIARLRSRMSRPVVSQADSKGGDPAADLLIKVSARLTQPNVLELTVRPKRIEIMNEAPAALVAIVQGDVAQTGALESLVARSLEKILTTN
jgi:hypothetical protein